MLTIQTLKLLLKLRNFDHPYIYDKTDLDFFTRITTMPTKYSQIESGEYAPEFDLSTCLISRTDELDYLIENKYIKLDHRNILITHKGYRFFQLSVHAVINFLARSVFTPIVVTIITTYILHLRP